MPGRKWIATRTKGLYEFNGYYHIKKSYFGTELSGTTGLKAERGKLIQAEAILEHQMSNIRSKKLMGVRGRTLFREAAAEYVVQNSHKLQIKESISILTRLDLYVGNDPIDLLHQNHDSILALIDDLKNGSPRWSHGYGHPNQKPRKKKTIWSYLEMIGRVLRFCVNDWRDKDNKPYLTTSPNFKLDVLPDDARSPHVITWEQHTPFLKELAPHHQKLYLFDVNTGLRDREITSLRHEWIHEVDNVGQCIVLPATWEGKAVTKGGKVGRVIPMNSIARQVYNEVKDDDDEFVFVYMEKPITRVINTSWKKTRLKMHEIDPKFPLDLHFHDARHTFGHRLRVAGVDKLTRAALLGHATGDITDLYSQEDLKHMDVSVEKITTQTEAVPLLSITNMYSS